MKDNRIKIILKMLELFCDNHKTCLYCHWYNDTTDECKFKDESGLIPLDFVRELVTDKES